jgi:hypothetical protein
MSQTDEMRYEALQDGDTRAEYKQFTVLFADVVHSMDIAAAVGTERLREVMTDLADRRAAVVERYGGTVDKFTGDGIMAVLVRQWRWRTTPFVLVWLAWAFRRRPSGLPLTCESAMVWSCSCGSVLTPVR